MDRFTANSWGEVPQRDCNTMPHVPTACTSHLAGFVIRGEKVKTILSGLFLLGLSATILADDPAKGQDRKVDLGRYRIALPPTWPAANPPKDPIVAIRKKDKDDSRQIGEILASTLPDTVEKESAELIDSAKKNPDLITAEESGDFVTKSGVKGKKVLLTIKAKDPNYGSPQAFYSIYLPLPDKGCVTIKLRCGSAEFPALRGEFEKIVSGAEQAAAK
jgi:hypothetical protein